MIHEEWIRAVLRDNPHIRVARLHALRDAMDDRHGRRIAQADKMTNRRPGPGLGMTAG